MSYRENRDRRTLYCGNLHEYVTEELLFELFLQSGPLETVTMKRDGRRSFAFITFKHEESVPYAEAIMENVLLFNRPLRLSPRLAYRDHNNNPNEPYTPELYVSDSSLHRTTSWHSPQPTLQQPPPQSLPVPLFPNNDASYLPQSQYQYEDRIPPQRHDRRKPPSYHPYSRNEQDYQNMKQRNGNFNHHRRGGAGGGGGGGGGYNNYYR